MRRNVDHCAVHGGLDVVHQNFSFGLLLQLRDGLVLLRDRAVESCDARDPTIDKRSCFDEVDLARFLYNRALLHYPGEDLIAKGGLQLRLGMISHDFQHLIEIRRARQLPGVKQSWKRNWSPFPMQFEHRILVEVLFIREMSQRL